MGYNLGLPFRNLTADAVGTVNTFLTDDMPLGGNDEHNGKWLHFSSGTNNTGLIRRVYDSAIDAGTGRVTLSFRPAITDATAIGDTAVLWQEDHNPTAIFDFINQAITDATGRVYDPVEDITLHADGKTSRFDIPTGISMIQKVQYRRNVNAAEVHFMERLFDETTDSDFTQALDTEDNRRGNSLKLTIGGDVGDGNFITDSFTALDLSGYTHLEGWTKASSTLAAADFVIHLDSGAVQANGTDLESLNVPATAAADTWTFHRIALANPESDTAIISIGLEYNANSGANTVHFDEWEATTNNSAIWADLPRHLWHIDKSTRDLVFDNGAVGIAGYSLLKLVGGDKPTLLTADATTSEIDDQYVIYRATALALMSLGGGDQTDLEDRFKRGATWMALAEGAKRSFPPLENVREVD